MKTTIGELKNLHRGCGKVRLMFQDEAGFGRINHPKYCWCEKGIRPCVPCHHIREYRYAYGAVEPLTFYDIIIMGDEKCLNEEKWSEEFMKL